VSVFGSTERFTTWSAGQQAFLPERETGATLKPTGYQMTYTASNGMVAVFDPVTSYEVFYPETQNDMEWVIRSVTLPNGTRYDFTYQSVVLGTYHCIEGPPECEPTYEAMFKRLQSVTTNHGYQLHLEYAQNNADVWGTHQAFAWSSVTEATLINNAIDYCAPAADSCTFSQDWPSLTITGAVVGSRSYTDDLGRTTAITFAGPNVTGIRLPGSASNDVTIGYSSNRVSSVNVNGLTTSYTYSDVSGTRTTSVDAPGAAGVTEVESSLTTGLISAVETPSGARTEYTYDADYLPDTITLPGGRTVEYAYDSRGNVTSVVARDSGGANPITTMTASYPASCSNPVTCNQPSWVEDAAGNRTDFTYDSTHGGVLTVTQPSPGSGLARPYTRIIYDDFNAWYYKGTGSVLAGPGPVYLPVEVQTCRQGSGPSCTNSSYRIDTDMQYGSSGVANNLLMTSTTEAAGNGALSATSTMQYDMVGNLVSLDPPLHGTNNRTAFFYDALRRPTGQIGPDPDAGGPLTHSAQRTTYNTRGQVSQVRFGTMPGYAVAWTSFSELERQTVTYDTTHRLSASRLITGSTTHALVQYSYDTAGRTQCVAQRMNPATFASPPSSACTPATAGSYGPDRITRTYYDTSSRRTQVTTAYGTSAAADEAAWTYTASGRLSTLTDGEGNRTTYTYDAFDRLRDTKYPSSTQGAGTSNGGDYERLTYDSYGRISQRRVRTGQVFEYTYDNLNRITNVDAPAGTADTSYSYDNHGRILTVSNGSQTITNT